MKKPDPAQLKKLLIITGVGGAIGFAVSALRGVFQSESAEAVFRILSDGALVGAVITGSIGLLGWLAGEGTFDAGSYVFGRTRSLFGKRKSEKKESFYEYRKRMAEKRTFRPKAFLVAGLFWLVLAFLFLGIWYLL